jgi:hypothetical protein
MAAVHASRHFLGRMQARRLPVVSLGVVGADVLPTPRAGREPRLTSHPVGNDMTK